MHINVESSITENEETTFSYANGSDLNLSVINLNITSSDVKNIGRYFTSLDWFQSI